MLYRKYTVELHTQLHVFSLIHHSVYLISCGPQADQILPKLPSPHARLSGPASAWPNEQELRSILLVKFPELCTRKAQFLYFPSKNGGESNLLRQPRRVCLSRVPPPTTPGKKKNWFLRNLARSLWQRRKYESRIHNSVQILIKTFSVARIYHAVETPGNWH